MRAKDARKIHQRLRLASFVVAGGDRSAASACSQLMKQHAAEAKLGGDSESFGHRDNQHYGEFPFGGKKDYRKDERTRAAGGDPPAIVPDTGDRPRRGKGADMGER
ncbi:hypothetical protein E2562_020168 [Oryza meyeriana var. granulata]|uniref:Uncharacterized protein n=1 Tax=Oryza meyeriana var. granulata TaxID=110450 RepID=A0A6G1BM03_9ORYZ|nr:hypothetical protein E2562_020168 [Oryza meyeriana var. granulata]